jgi:hypothetical protein
LRGSGALTDCPGVGGSCLQSIVYTAIGKLDARLFEADSFGVGCAADGDEDVGGPNYILTVGGPHRNIQVFARRSLCATQARLLYRRSVNPLKSCGAFSAE